MGFAATAPSASYRFLIRAIEPPHTRFRVGYGAVSWVTTSGHGLRLGRQVRFRQRRVAGLPRCGHGGVLGGVARAVAGPVALASVRETELVRGQRADALPTQGQLVLVGVHDFFCLLS